MPGIIPYICRMILKTAAAAVLVIAGLLLVPLRKATALEQPVIITEIQTQSTESKTEEFIEITNTAASAARVDGWRVAYLSATGTTPTILLTLEGAIKGSSSILLSKSDYLVDADGFFTKGLSETGGHILIFNDTEQEIDRVGWGGALYPKLSAAAPPDTTKSLQRKISSGVYSRLEDNSKDFELAAPTPKGGGLTEVAEEVTSACSSLIITEVLANPEGSDTANEFVELFNPTNTDIAGEGCSIKTSKGSVASLKGATIKSKSYYALGFSDGLLNNGGAVSLISAEAESTLSYPKAASGQSWALINNIWQYTDKPTPNQPNELAITLEEDEEDTQTVKCPGGKYRDPETNRCRNIASVATVTPCNTGQERNPATGRCRKIAQATATTSCPAGQERNVETNRCRKIATISEPKPCDVGQERNLETGRCRKATATKASAAQVPQQINKSFEWASIAVAALGIAALAGYEYRHEIGNWCKKLRSRLQR